MEDNRALTGGPRCHYNDNVPYGQGENEMLYPGKLRPNGLIGVCAPSSGVSEQMHGRLDAAVRNVNALGYRCVETESVRKTGKCVSAGPEQRAREFVSLCENPEVSAIIPPWGGEFLMELLPHLDFGRLAGLPPNAKDFTLTDALRCSFEGLGLPVLYDADIGHTPPQMQIVNGSFGEVSFREGRASVTQRLI